MEPHAPVGFDHSPINGVPAIDKVVLVERGEKMDLEIVFRFSPPSAFGLPGDDFLVIPGGENGQKQIVSSTIDSVTGNQLLEGTLSSYREVGQGVNMEFVVGSYVGRLRDNVLFLHTNATDTDNVVAQSQEIAESLALWLSHHLSAVISASLVQFVDRTAGQRIPTMRTRAWLRARYYHVPTIERGVKDWLDGDTADSLAAGLRYYRMGSFLLEQGQASRDDFRSQLVSEAILNFYKSVSVILGDPSAGDRDWQRRYRQFGLSDEFFKTEVEWLRKDIRNHGDVAHYRLQAVPIDESMEWAMHARRIAQQVIEGAKSARSSAADV